MLREELSQRAKIAEQAERFDDMAGAMKGIIELLGSDELLSTDERNLFSIAYKNVMGSRRSSLRLLSSLTGKASKIEMASEYEEKMKVELNIKCNEVLHLLDVLIKNSEKQKIKDEEESETTNYKVIENLVFYLKMKGDYQRYLAEIGIGLSSDGAVYEAEKAYELATKEASKLPKTNPIRLGLALNFSVFYYEIVRDTIKACELARRAFEDAVSDLDTLKEDSYKDCTSVMQLLKDNLTSWTLGPDNEDQEK